MRLLFIINPTSGSGQKDLKKIIEDWFLDKEHILNFYVLEAKEKNEPRIFDRINFFKPDRIIAAGGDGTLKMMAGILVNRPIPLAILPTGSANGMARELNIPTNISDALKLCIEENAAPIDLLRINNEWCIHLSDIGLNATLLHHFETFTSRGMLGYAKALFKVFGRKTYMPVTIRADGKTYERKALMIVIANAAKYGTGAVINPNGKPDDGLFELVIVQRLAFKELFTMLITRRPFDPRNIEVIACRSAEINTRHGYPFQIDGEYLGKTKKINVEIAASVLQVVRPIPPDLISNRPSR